MAGSKGVTGEKLVVLMVACLVEMTVGMMDRHWAELWDVWMAAQMAALWVAL